MRLGTLFVVYLGTTATAIVSPFALRVVDTAWRQAMPVNSEAALEPAPELHPGRPQPLQPVAVCAAAAPGAKYYDNGDFSVGGDASDCRKYLPDIKVSLSAVGEDGTLYLEGPRDGQNALSVYRRTGELKWTVPIDEIDNPLALGRDGTAYLLVTHRLDSTLTAYTADGNVRWRVQYDGEQLGGWVPPAIDPDGTIYIFSGVPPTPPSHCRICPAIVAISPQGQERWRVAVTGRPADLIVDSDGRVLVNESWGNLLALDPQGHRLWSFASDDKLGHGGIAIAGDGTVYFASRFLYALDRRGKTKWVFRPQSAYTEGEGLEDGPVVAEDDTVYAFSIHHELFAITAAGHEKWVVNDLPPGDSGVELSSTGILRTPSAWFSVSSGLASRGWPSANRDGRNSRSQEGR